MTFDLYGALISLAVCFAQFLIGSLKRFLIWSLFLLLFLHFINLEYPSYDDSYESDEEQYDKLGSESGPGGTFGIVFGGLLRGVGLP